MADVPVKILTGAAAVLGCQAALAQEQCNAGLHAGIAAAHSIDRRHLNED